MAFLSLKFYGFCLVTAAVYRLLPRGARAAWLLAAGWFFYLCTGVEYAPFLLAVIVVSYLAGRLLEQKRGRKWVVAAAAAAFVGLLFLLKYLGFALSLVGGLLGALGLESSSPALALLLPAGVSFYTLQAVGYVVDVYRGTAPANRSFLRHALFLSFFPQVLSGPIPRAAQLMPQLDAAAAPTWDDLRAGCVRFLWGAWKKTVLADRLGLFTATVFAAPGNFGRLQLAMAAVAFSLQIYCDFSAYSDMALGVARMLGITLMENFRAPYFARSIQGFWRRWHISLSTWFRDYLYIPLGGNRRGRLCKWRNLLLVFALSGLWHGAGLTFLVWGLLNGLYQVVGEWTLPLRRRARAALRIPEEGRLTRWAQVGITFVLATLAWVFFQSADLPTALAFLGGLFRGPWWVYVSMGADRWDLLIALAGLLLLWIADRGEEKMPLAERVLGWRWSARWCAALALLAVTVIWGCYGPGYNAADFIYFKF